MFPFHFFSDNSTHHVISLSGGKDSLALWLLAREKGIDNMTVVFADTGHEHPYTYDYISLLEQKLGPIIRVCARFERQIINKRHYIQTIWPVKLVDKYGYTPQEAEWRVDKALENLYPYHIPFLDLCILKGRFPSTRARFCTFELKHRPIEEQIIRPLLTQFDEVVSWQGVRAQEPASRARLAEYEADVNNQPGLHLYRPLLHWTHDEVFALARRHGILLPTVQNWVFRNLGGTFKPEDSSHAVSVARTLPDHTSGVSASSAGLHGLRLHHYSICCLWIRVLLLHQPPSRPLRVEGQ
jgi:3'-phosphoadenosine 5'-phosphosulfate sulfotransferase (PAPS reductase)/FAD synthetase